MLNAVKLNKCVYVHLNTDNWYNNTKNLLTYISVTYQATVHKYILTITLIYCITYAKKFLTSLHCDSIQTRKNYKKVK